MIISCKFRRIFRSVWLKLPSTPSCTVEITQFTLLYGWNYPARPSVWLKFRSTPFCTIEIILYTLQYGWNYPARPPVRLKLSSTPSCMVEITQYTLQYGWNYPARPERAEALSPGQRPGYKAISNAPCKGKSFKTHLITIENPLRYVKLLPFQGVLLGLLGLLGVAAVGLLGLRLYLKPANFKRIIQKKRENDGNLRK